MTAAAINFLLIIQSSLTHSLTLLSDAPDENLRPSCQSPVPTISASSFPLCPIPDEADVQNGITVFPVKSLAFTNPSTLQAAIPHQIGYPINTVS